MDERNLDSFNKLLFDNALGNIESSRHTDKQRRWRAKKKDQHHRPQLSLHRLQAEEINESRQYSYDINENFENDVTLDNRIFDDNTIVHDSPMDDTHSDVTRGGGTFDDDTLVHDYIFDDDDYNYSFDFNLNSVQSDEIIVEQEDEPLYSGAPVTFKSYHKQILEFGNSVKLSDSDMNKLLQLIGNALPIENKLLKSYKKLLTAFKTTSSFNQELKCKYCLRRIDRANSCSLICEQNKSQRRIGDIIEHVSINRSYGQLIEIIRRNKHLILDYPQIANNLLPCDVISGSTYQEKRKNLKSLNGTYPVTLMIHIDGFQLVHWTKKHSWLVTASIAEIPPPLRENKLNMLLLSLWNSSEKPDANSLLDEICDTIKQTVIVDNINFVVDVLLFKADLPARALATKHVNHNGYYACLECDQKGVWYEEGRTVIYPYIPHRMNRRSSSHFDFCAEQVNQQLSCDNYYGIKGVSPLRKIMDIPNQIDIDIMHLCFIGHCNFLLCKWEKMIVKQSWLSGNDFLKTIKWPHNFNVELQSLSDRTYWKAHDYRSFLLYVMFPFVFSFFPENISSHFSLYFVFVRTLYFYHDLHEVTEVEQLVKIYCEHAQQIYGKAFYLYSSHAHLHLVEKVIKNGAFCFHNCFPNESFVRFLRSLRSGNRALAHQICSSLEKFRCTIKKETLSISNIFFDEKLIIDDFLDREYISTYKSQFLDSVKSIITSTNDPRRRGNTQSFIVSFHDDRNNKCFGQIIFFYELFGDPLRSRQHNPTFATHRPANESLSTVIHSTTNNQNNCAPSPTVTGSPAKRRRTFPGQSNPPLTAPPVRRRFDATLQNTAASLMENIVVGTTTSTSRTTTANAKSISETSQNGINQIIKPIVKLCEETNQLTKDVLKILTEQTNLTRELVNFPRDLQKATQQLSHTIHMQAKVFQSRQQSDDEDVSIELNGINVSHVQRGASINATARALVRAGYGEMASFNDLRPGEFDILLSYLAYIHGLHPATTFANSQSIKNSLQQMKHDVKKQTPNQSSKRNSTTTQQINVVHDDDE
ncbi:unnamed protein product, partial [Rotaria magnacalcarata]